MNITFIGGGNMARSLIGGLVSNAQDPAEIIVSDPYPEVVENLSRDFGVRGATSNNEAVAASDVVVLAVKPQQMFTVVDALKSDLNEQLLISIAAGVRCKDIAKWSGNTDVALVRCMPNTPALLQCGATALFASESVSVEQRKSAETVLLAAGLVAWVSDENQLDAITALSGSGPAYFFLMLEAMTDAAVASGLPRDLATTFAIQTAVGASRMASEGGQEPSQLRRNVTSPAGTTEAAINSFVEDDFSEIVRRAMQAANDRAVELGKELGDNNNG